MKICPICSQTYGDESLTFCLNDGAVLEQMVGTAKTAVMSQAVATSPNRQTEPPQSEYPTVPFSSDLPRAEARNWLWILLAFGGLILIAGGGYLAWRMLRPAQEDRNNTPSNSKFESTGTRVTLTPEKYNNLKNGMSYRQVVEIMGSEGAEFSRSEVGQFKTVLYKWEDGAANVLVTFSNDRLIVKAQSGVIK